MASFALSAGMQLVTLFYPSTESIEVAKPDILIWIKNGVSLIGDLLGRLRKSSVT